MGKYRITGWFWLLGLLLLSILFFRERTCYLDPAAQLFEMLNEGQYAIFVKRYSMAVNLTLPMIGIWLKLPLTVILLLYSVSFFLIHLFCYWLIGVKWKNPGLALAFASTLVICRFCFVHSISETYLGITYSALLVGWLSHYSPDRKNWKFYIFYPVAAFFILLNYYLHPVTLFTLVIGLGWVMFEKDGWKNLNYWAIFCMIIALYGYKFFAPHTSHEEGFFSGIKQAPDLLPRFWTLNSFIYFTKAWGLYIYPGILYAILSLYFFMSRKFREWLYLSVSLTGFLLVIFLTFHQGDSSLGMESRFLPLMFLIMVPLSTYVLKTRYLNYLVFALLFFMGLWSLKGIYQTTSYTYTARMNYMDALLSKSAEQGVHKSVYQFNDIESDKLLVKWAIGIESLLYASSKGEARTLFLIEDVNTLAPDAMQNPTVFFMVPSWIYFDAKKINPDYMLLPEETYTYMGNKNVYAPETR